MGLEQERDTRLRRQTDTLEVTVRIEVPRHGLPKPCQPCSCLAAVADTVADDQRLGTIANHQIAALWNRQLLGGRRARLLVGIVRLRARVAQWANEQMPSVVHHSDQFANNRAEVSHQATRQRGRQMRRFKSAVHLQRFASVHGVVQNLFRVGRHLLRAAHYRLLRTRAFAEWEAVACAN